MSDFEAKYGPWAVVTGAAQGVGLAFTEDLLERGLSVVLVDRNPMVVEVAAGLGQETRAVVADLSDVAWLGDLAAATEGLEMGLAIANAATTYVGRFLDQSVASREAMLQVNCRATMDLAAWALPTMIERGRGGFVVTSSGSALAGTAAVATYSASKAFVLNLAEAIGWELRDTGVDCLAIVAPAMDTPGWRSHPVDESKMLVAASEPRAVVHAALDHLAAGGCWMADEGLEMVAGIDRGQRVDLLSSVTSAMYPDEYH